jgi:hypothetical protein
MLRSIRTASQSRSRAIRVDLHNAKLLYNKAFQQLNRILVIFLGINLIDPIRIPTAVKFEKINQR